MKILLKQSLKLIAFYAATSAAWGYPAPVPQTGATGDGTAYTAADGTSGSSTLAPGSDASLTKGVASPNPRFVANTNPTATVGVTVPNGTITDKLTGLIWLVNANCGGVATTWTDANGDNVPASSAIPGTSALSWIKELNAYGKINSQSCGDTSKYTTKTKTSTHQTDWRLPNVRELDSLIQYGRRVVTDSNGVLTSLAPVFSAGTPVNPFTNSQSAFYWSSTSYIGGDPNAWVVNFADGGTALFLPSKMSTSGYGIGVFVTAVRGP